MIHYMRLGKVAPKPHVTFHDEGKLLMEQCFTREGFYVLIPRSTPYRIHWDGGNPEFFVFEGRGHIDIPKEFRNRSGQITDFAPYSHRDFRAPETLLTYSETTHGKPPFKLIIKR